MNRRRWLRLVVLGLTLLGPKPGQAGTELGSFVWRIAPFCNVVTLNVVQEGPAFSLSGFDDNCGGAHSAAYGAASFNPDGTVSLGLTVLAANGAAEQFNVVLTAASGFSGTWQDATGNTGDFLINPPLPTAGTPRPSPAVNGALLLPGSVTNGALAAGAVTGDKLPAAVDGSRILDTIDPTGIELRVGGERALRLEPATSGTFGVAPNVIGGFSGNTVTPGVVGATIAGGGTSSGDPGGCSAPCLNKVTADFGAVGGGLNNTASGSFATVGGGESNTAGGIRGTIGGGLGNTASSTGATVGGGQFNTASFVLATVGGGQFNTASGLFATVPGGTQALASLYGQMAYASGLFAAIGDAQTSVFVLRNSTTNATQTELFLDGTAAFAHRITLAAGRTMTFDILITARETAGAAVGASAGFQVRGVISNVSGTTALVGAPTTTPLGADAAAAAWAVAVQADNTNDALAIKVTGVASTTIRWVAVVRTAEVAQ